MRWPSGCATDTSESGESEVPQEMTERVTPPTLAETAHHDQPPRSAPAQVRQRIGMVFQKPNPFPKSIYDNVAFGPRVLGRKDDLDATVERALRRAALWDEVKD